MAEPYEKLSEDDLVELSLLRDFETDALIAAELLNTDEQLSRPLDQELIMRFGELDLNVKAGVSYPICPVTWHIENHTLSRTSVDSLRGTIRDIVEAAKMTNNLSRWQTREVECEMGIFEPVQVVLHLAQATQSHVGHPPLPIPTGVTDPVNDNYLPFITRPSVPIDASTALEQMTTTAFQLLRKTPKEICANISSSYRVLHIEPVLRGNLLTQFDKQRRELGDALSKLPSHKLRPFVPSPHKRGCKKDLIEYLLRPRLTFHGTQRDQVSSIVRYGFLCPGTMNPKTKEEHMVRCGSTYGRGIYSSPEASFSLQYSGYYCHRIEPDEFFGIKLLVCATLMGRSAKISRADNWRDQTEPYPGADSHVANDGKEYIVFSSSQIIPVYLIHIDWGRGNEYYFRSDD
ncbi:hypothetical protein F4859DRAFT_119687 [Xylaria cf. heliscus]|nr:hypothetical protein F4859DRAFT_119687 [Xylaria cf. heliscus]